MLKSVGIVFPEATWVWGFMVLEFGFHADFL